MPIHFPDSIDIERPFFSKVLAKSQDISPTVVTGIGNIRDFTRKYTTISCTVFNLYRLSQLYSPIYNPLNSQLFPLI